MKRRSRKVIVICGIIAEVIALFLIVFGLYVRFAGTGNPVGTVYLLAGNILALGGAIVEVLIARSKADRL